MLLRTLPVIGRPPAATVVARGAADSRPGAARWLVTGFVHALHVIVVLLPSRRDARSLRSTRCPAAWRPWRVRASDSFVRTIAPVSPQWLADYSQRAAKHGP